MAHGYFVSSRKDKSRKVKEIPPPVKPISYSITRRLSSSASPHSTPSIIQVHQPQPHPSRSPAIVSPVPSVLTEPHYAPSFQRSGKLNNVHASTARPRLSVSVPNVNGQRMDQGMPFHGYEPTLSRHTDPVPFIFAKVLAQDYHHLPGPMAMDVIRDGGGKPEDYYYCSSPSSPGLSPDSSGSSPIERVDEPVWNPFAGHVHVDVERQQVYRKSLVSVTLPSLAEMDLGDVNVTRSLAFLGPVRLPEDEKALQKLSGYWSKLF